MFKSLHKSYFLSLKDNCLLQLSISAVKNLLSIYSFFIIHCSLFILVGCATVINPTGGPKDITPPKVVNSAPPDFSRNFNSDYIRINFNKFIRANNINNNAIISPPLKKSPEYSVKGRSLIIRLKEHLRDTTTYTISLENSISDIRENNLATNLQYVFSTGKLIDSLNIAGKVIDAYTLKPEKDVYVMLYSHKYDSVPLKERPVYISRTDAKGNFELKNLRNDKYKIFALKDVNANFLYDQPNEKIAFIDSLAIPYLRDTITKDTLKNKRYFLNIFQENDSLQKLIKSWVVTKNQIQFIFRYPVTKLNVYPLNFKPAQKWYYSEFSKTRDTLNLWLIDYKKDSIILSLKDGKKFSDTVKLNLSRKSKSKLLDKLVGKEDKIFFRLNVNKNTSFDFYKPILLASATPVKEFQYNKIKLLDNKDTILPSVRFSDSINRKIEISYNFKDDHNYKLFIPPHTFKDIYGLTNDTIKVDFKTQELKYYATIKLIPNFSDFKISRIIQLLDEHDNVIREVFVKTRSNIIFDHIPPVKYKLRMILDANKNGKWDTGNYLRHIQPEKVIYYSKPVSARSNWDLEIEWVD